MADDLVRLPGGVDLAVAEEVGRVDSLDGLSHCLSGRNVGLRPSEMEVVDLTLGGQNIRGRLAALQVGAELEL